MKIFENPNFNFVRWRWHAIALSWLVILAGLIVVGKWGMPRGVEFSGGTIVIIKFQQSADVQSVRTGLDRAMPGMGQSAIVNRYGDATANQVMIRVPTVGAESGTSLSATKDAVVGALNKANLGTFQVVGTGSSADRRRAPTAGTLATVLALGAPSSTSRCGSSSASPSAVVATVHDLLVTMAFSRSSATTCRQRHAAIPTITGYWSRTRSSSSTGCARTCA